MIYNSFLEWVAEQQANEAMVTSLPPDVMAKNFSYFEQKQGDMVYFGIHDIMKAVKETGDLPPLIDPSQVIAKGGQIVEADPTTESLIVTTQQAPWHYGYRNLEDTRSRQNRAKKGIEIIKVPIPKYFLEDISAWVPGAGAGGRRVWLVIDRSTSLQKKLHQLIIRKRMEREQQSQQANPMEPQIDPNDQARVDALFKQPQQGLKQVQMEPGNPQGLDALFGVNKPKAPPLQQFMMQNRNVIKTDPNQMRQGRPRMPWDDEVEVAHYNPVSSQWGWKVHADEKKYDYYPE